MTEIEKFAKAHHLKLTRDGQGDDLEKIVLGRIGESSIYDYYDEGQLAVSFMTDNRKAPRTGLWNTFKAACVEAGMTPRQIGDAEGTFSFDPKNAKQAKVAIKGIRARVKRQMSAEQAKAGAERLAAARLARQKVQNSQQEASVEG
jgi:hypothetical protein